MPGMTPEIMLNRTKKVGVTVIKACDSMPRKRASWVVTDQIIRASTSVGANYRAARRGRSSKEFLAKLGTVEEEADETLYWLEVAVAADLLHRDVAKPIWKEVNEILSIIVATKRSTRGEKF